MQSVQHSGQAFQVTEIEQGVFQVHFDLKSASVNVFNHTVFAELTTVLEQLEEQPLLHGCVFTSGKGTFAAGADIPVISAEVKNKTEDEVYEYIGVGHTVFNKLQSLPCVTVAAINGIALGGGCEFVLACDLRVIVQDAVVGLPEVNLGIFPGWGGTVRLPRIMSENAHIAAQWIASGAPQTAETLQKYDVVSAVVNKQEQLLKSALLLIKQHQGHYDDIRLVKTQPLVLSDASQQAMQALLQELARKPGPHYPASQTAVQCVLDHATLAGDEAGQMELKRFSQIIKTDTAVNLLSVFLNEQATKKVVKRYVKEAQDSAAAAVIGDRS